MAAVDLASRLFGEDGAIQRLAEIALDPLAIVGSDGEFEWGNRAMRHALAGEGGRHLVGSFLDYLHPQDIAFGQLIFERAAQGSAAQNCVLRVRVHQGGYRDWECSIVAEGPRANMSCRDVTLRNHQEREVMRQLELLRMAERHASVGHWQVDLATGQIDWSDITYEIHGVPRTYVPEMARAIEFYHPDDRAMVEAAVAAAVDTASGFHFTARLVRADGEIVNVMSRAAIETDEDGQAVAIFGIFQDITEQLAERKRVEQAARLKSLGTFAAGIAHEVNNPLAFTTANLDYIRSVLESHADGSALDTDVAEAAVACADALDGTRRVAMIVEKLRTFSTGQAEVASVVDVVGLIDDLVHDLSVDFAATIHVETSTPTAHVVGDEVVLHNVFEEVVRNAITATAGVDEARIDIRIDRVGETVVIEFIDNGCGIADSDLGRIFDPFYTTKAVDEGRGLGLSTCLGVVNALGGSIAFQSAVGMGTTATIALPATEPSGTLAGSTVSEIVTETHHVYVLDDEMRIGRALTRLLAPDYVVTSFDNASAMLGALAAGDRPDAVLCDISVGGTDGFEMLRRIESEFPELAGRFAFLAGGPLSETVTESLEGARVPYVSAPLEVEAVVRVLERLLAD